MASSVFQRIPAGPKLNLGCGPVQPKGWINIDGSNRAWLCCRMAPINRLLVKMRLIPESEFQGNVIYHNLLKGIPYQSGSVSCIYAGELWEHFEFHDADRLTRECHRVLAPGGVLRVCVPEGPAFWKKYLEIYDGLMGLPREKRSAGPLRNHVRMYFHDICVRKSLFGSMGHTHKWQYDEIQLIDLFESCGFRHVERMSFHESRIPDIAQIERSNYLIIEGSKQ